MIRALGALERGGLTFTPQAAEGATYARKLGNAETRIDWTRPARAVHDLVRGLAPAPGAWFEADLGKGPERVKLLRSALDASASGPAGTVLDGGRIACGEGAIRLVAVQRAGSKPMSYEDFARGARLATGTVLA